MQPKRSVRYICSVVLEESHMIERIAAGAVAALALAASVGTGLFGWPPNERMPWPISAAVAALAIAVFLVFELGRRAYRLDAELIPTLEASFEHKKPWVNWFEKSRTRPKDGAPGMIETRSVWFRLLVTNTSPTRPAPGVRAYLTNVEVQKAGRFCGVDFGTSMQLKWANDTDPLAPKDITFGTQKFVDVLSTNEHRNEVTIKWEADWMSNEGIFNDPGTYRLTILVAPSAGAR